MREYLQKHFPKAWEMARVCKGRLTSMKSTFDSIYRDHTWAHQPGMLSGTGSYGKWAETYIAFITKFISEHQIETITDIGCGDFNIGRQLCPLVKHYYALDVSSEIIKINQEKYSYLKNVSFRCVDARQGLLPQADLVTVRQVFQHLRNKQIEAVLRNMEKSAYSYALITEHLPMLNQLDRPNIDVPYQSANTRIEQGSGVIISQAPFSRKTSPILRIPAEETTGEELVVFLWKPADSAGPTLA